MTTSLSISLIEVISVSVTVSCNLSADWKNALRIIIQLLEVIQPSKKKKYIYTYRNALVDCEVFDDTMLF